MSSIPGLVVLSCEDHTGSDKYDYRYRYEGVERMARIQPCYYDTRTETGWCLRRHMSDDLPKGLSEDDLLWAFREYDRKAVQS